MQLFVFLKSDLQQFNANADQRRCINGKTAQEWFALGEVVQHSLVSDLQVHYAEPLNLKLKQYELSAPALEHRCKVRMQYALCIAFQENLLSLVSVLNQ